MTRTPLVFSIALNGYDHVYGRLIDGQERYARRHGFDYSCAGSGLSTGLGAECTWLKLMLMLEALETGRPWVMCLDTDCGVRSWCPDFRKVDRDGKSVFLADGFSGRPNSGVMIVKNDERSRAFFERCLLLRGQPLPEEEDVGWGENGAVIYTANRDDCVERISRRWNNNGNPVMIDYIRHYTGRLRRLTPLSVRLRGHAAKRKAVHRARRKHQLDTREELERLKSRIVAADPAFAPA